MTPPRCIIVPCWNRTADPSGICDECREKMIRKDSQLAAAQETIKTLAGLVREAYREGWTERFENPHSYMPAFTDTDAHKALDAAVTEQPIGDAHD